MAKRKATSSPAISRAYDSDEIHVAPLQNFRQEAQKTSHDASNSRPVRPTRLLKCVLVPVPTQQELVALLDANTTSTEPSAEWSEHSVAIHDEIKVPAYEQPLEVNGKRSRKSTYKSLTTSEFFFLTSRPDEVRLQAARASRPTRRRSELKNDGPLHALPAQPQTARESRLGRKSPGQHDHDRDHSPLHVLLAGSSAHPAQKLPTKSANRPPAKSLPTQLPSPEASTPNE
jgi:hypothetical protein